MGLRTSNPVRRMWGAMMGMFGFGKGRTHKNSIPSPPTGGKPDRTVHIGKGRYRCSLFPGTIEKRVAQRRAARKKSHASRMKNARLGYAV